MTFAQPFKDYEILERVGAGAMGTVFKARHTKLGRIVALKVLRPSLARDERYVDRLRREARIVASLNHPNVVTGYDLGEEGGYHYFVMEFVAGKSLRALLAEWGMFPEPKVLEVAVQVAAALDHAFQKGVIHRDIKPGNILIDDRGVVKLTDLGLAKGPTDLTLTRDGATVGTPQYISPEQARSPQDVDVRSDLYSLGATLYHMATGQPPFRGETMADVILKVMHEVAPEPRELNPALGEGLSLVIRKLLAKDVAHRYQTPQELLQDLERVQRAEAPAVDRRALEAAERPARISRLQVAGLVLAAAALLGGAVWFGQSLRPGPETVRPDVFFAALDHDLQQAADGAARWQVLVHAAAAAPPGTQVGLRERQTAFCSALQERVDAVVRELLAGVDRHELDAWLRDRASWPQEADFEHERVTPLLLQRTGFTRSQLPAQVQSQDLDRLLGEVLPRLVRVRDAGLLAQWQHFVDVELSARSEELRLAADFAGAEQVWVGATAEFFDGARWPRPERLVAAVRARADESLRLARDKALLAIGAAETAMARALRAEAAAGHQLIAAADAAPGADADLLLQRLQALRQALQAAYPARRCFRAGQDPWTEVERAHGELVQRLQLQQAQLAQARAGWRLDLAYRTLLLAGPQPALELLRGGGEDAAAAALAPHCRLFAAAATVGEALLAALARLPNGFEVCLRASPLLAQPAVVRLEEGHPVLQLAPPSGRTLAVTEVTLPPLLAAARRADAKWSAAVPAAELDAGMLLLALVGDDLAGVRARLPSVGEPFVLSEVWPRLERLRQEQGGPVLDRASLLARLAAAAAAARRSGRGEELRTLLQSCHERFGTDPAADEQREVAAATAVLQRLDELQQLRAQLVASAPAGAEAQVRDAGAFAELRVRVAGSALPPLAGDGWTAGPAGILFPGAPLPTAAMLPKARVEAAFGLPTSVPELACTCDVVLPAAAAGERLLVLELRGVVAVLLFTADDAVFAALAQGSEPLREEALRKAVQRAYAQALDGHGRVHCLPGGVQQVRMAVAAPPGRQRGRVTLAFGGSELLSEPRDLDPRRGAEAALYPAGAVQLRAVELVGRLPR